MTTIDHDVPTGRLDRCQISGSTNLNCIIDLGVQPPCDALVSTAGLHLPEISYPLRLMHCPDSGLAQLDYIVDGREIYPADYPYRSGISKPLEEYQRAFAKQIVDRFDIDPKALVVDIGSNDGTLLSGFKLLGHAPLGVEPTDIAQIARDENGIETLQEFFTERVAANIVKERGRAAIITMTNVFAHMASLGKVMRGLAALLDAKGVFITESHYLLDVLEKNQFDTIYHEHIRTYSLKALVQLFPQYGMEVFDVERSSRYGGNIRAYVGWRGKRPVEWRVGALLEEEDRKGLHTVAAWAAFRSRVYEQRDAMMQHLYSARSRGSRVVGKSCPGRASTLLNFYGVTPDLMPYLAELPTSLKLGKFLPGKHIPIVPESVLFRDRVDEVVLLSWHYSEVIAPRLRAAGLSAIMTVPLPYFKEV